MLESMRKHTQGWIAKVILGAIILSFALWGVGDYFTGNQVETVAEIDGEAIYDVEFAETYRRQLATYANMLGDQFNKELAEQLGVKNETIQTMVNRRLMLMEAGELGLVVPDQAVLATVQSNPAFREANQFSTGRYQGLVRQMGFATPRDYENYLRQSIMINTLQTAIVESASVSDAEVKARFNASFEKRVIAALIVNPASLKPAIKVSDEQARDWYESHASAYQSPLKVELQVVDINAEDLMDEVSISDEDVAQAYAERQAEFGTPEKRKAAHILVRVSKDASKDVLEMAQVKIKAAKERIAAGESFADVAKDVSDDVTATEGGDLGYFARGSMVPAFDKVVFEQLKVGDVSDVVRTQFGFHLIQLNDVKAADVQPLAEVSAKLKAELRNEAAVNEAYRLSQDLDNALGMEDSLQSAAESVNLPVKKLGQLSTENVLANPLLGGYDELKKKAFSSMPGDAVEIIEVNNGHFVALEVLNRINPQTMDYEEVVKQVYEDVANDLAAKQAQDIAQDILRAAQEGESVQSLTQNFGQPVFTSKAVRSNGEGDDALWLSNVLRASFGVPEGNWVNHVMPTSEGIAVVYVQQVEHADEKVFAEEAGAVRDETLKAKGAVRFARWMASVRDRHDISINNRVLERF
ncbi:MAG: SurA N-terminal domain-containing protein [Ghiorsea sp.]|nr:SurA N-terminal domain-containing protein [Ghiorsea sp.]